MSTEFTRECQPIRAEVGKRDTKAQPLTVQHVFGHVVCIVCCIGDGSYFMP